jgi:hypothetical protein
MIAAAARSPGTDSFQYLQSTFELDPLEIDEVSTTLMVVGMS